MTSSYNGWTASKDRKAIGVVPFTVNGIEFPAGVKGGDVHFLLSYVAAQFFKRVEKPINPGCWGFNYRQNRNSNNLSCHASGTAIDLNAPKHPNGKSGTFTARQVTEIREILAECSHAIRWGGDFSGTKDEMHFEVKVNAAAVKQAVAKIKQRQAKPAAPQPADPRLHQGTKGERVRGVQDALIRAGYSVIADGDFGPGTHRALVAFQEKHKLNGDGITWASTWAALRKYPA